MYENLSNITSLTGVFVKSNEIMNGLFFYASIATLWVIAFMMLKQRFRTEQSISASLFLAAVYTALLMAAGLVSYEILIIMLILTGFSVLLL
jgi:hypothetical protein